MEIKVGDKVRVSKDIPQFYRRYNSYRVFEVEHQVVDIEDGLALLDSIPPKYVTTLPLKYLTKVEDKAKAKYRRGDRVYVLGSELLKRGVYTIIGVEHRERLGWYYQINIHEWHPEIDLEPYTEPTVPTIKVGDFVRVLENIHEPFCLDVERHLEITDIPPHAVSQKEWKVISVEMRRDCAGRIYTLKHDDSFIYNIPEDCVERVEPKEQTEAEKKPNIGSITIPVEVDLTDSYWEQYTADLAKEIAVKLSKPNENKPGYVADYAVSVAKAVVENLKKK